MRKTAAQPRDPGPKKNFLVVSTPAGREYWDAQAYRPHPTGDGTLQIQRDGAAQMVAMYSAGGWLKYSWELRWAHEVDDLRVDGRLPF